MGSSAPTGRVALHQGNWHQSTRARTTGRGRPSIRSFLQRVYRARLPYSGKAAFGEGRAESKREALRQFLHNTLQPYGDMIAAEARHKLAVDIRFGFDRLFASDIQGRARAFQSMVGAGMDVAKAAALAGLVEPE